MSVILYEYDECEGIANELVKLPDLEKVVMSNKYVMQYNSQQMPVQMKYKFEDVIGRLLWYMYVANRVAYSLQYQENVDLFVKGKKAKEYTPEQARIQFGSLNYNIYTNNGTVFLSSEWLGLVSDIQKFIKEKHPRDFEKGGKTDEVVVKQEVYTSNGNTYTLEEYQKLSNEEFMGYAPLDLEDAKNKLFEINEEAYDYQDEINEIESVDELADFVYENDLGSIENTYNSSWWGGVRLFILVHNDGNKVDYDYPTMVFLAFHRGGDVRGNYEKYEAFAIDNYLIEDFPIFADRMSITVEKDGKSLTADTEDMEGYDLYIQQSDFDEFEEGDSTNLDEIGDKLGFEAYMYYEAGGTLPTPFGQAGLVGETGTLNEIDLFAMGGDLPQGVHQYYANTYNPAYPTPHGYAKGGEVSVYGTNGKYYLKKYGRTYSNPSYKTKKEAENWARLINKGEYKLSNQGLEYVEEKNRFAKGGKVKVQQYGYTLHDFDVKNKKEAEQRINKLLNRYNKKRNKTSTYSIFYEDENGKITAWQKFAKGGKTQGYNDKLDESLGNTKGKRSTKEQNYKDRRNESEAMEKKGGKRKYARVKTMDKGNRKKRKTPMTLAKEIRKEGEAWKDAVKRASAMMKKK